MRFRAGIYSIRIKSFTNKDLDLSDDYQHLRFDLYQKIFHVLFIPIFPDEKEWKVTNIITSKIADTNPEIRTALNLKSAKTKKPLFSYLGTIIFTSTLIFLFGLIIFEKLMSEYTKYDHKKYRIEANKPQNAKELELISNPKLKDLYSIKTFEVANKKVGSKYKISKSSKTYLWYTLYKFTDDSLFLILQKKHYTSSFIKLKDTVSISKKDISKITNQYRKVDFYTKSGNQNLELVFNIDNIKRKDTE